MQDIDDPNYYDQIHHLACETTSSLDRDYKASITHTIGYLVRHDQFHGYVRSIVEDSPVPDEYDLDVDAVTDDVIEQLERNFS